MQTHHTNLDEKVAFLWINFGKESVCDPLTRVLCRYEPEYPHRQRDHDESDTGSKAVRSNEPDGKVAHALPVRKSPRVKVDVFVSEHLFLVEIIVIIVKREEEGKKEKKRKKER